MENNYLHNISKSSSYMVKFSLIVQNNVLIRNITYNINLIGQIMYIRLGNLIMNSLNSTPS